MLTIEKNTSKLAGFNIELFILVGTIHTKETTRIEVGALLFID
jgi:hypothetical protein